LLSLHLYSTAKVFSWTLTRSSKEKQISKEISLFNISWKQVTITIIYSCDYITIGENDANLKEKKAIIFTSRVHPG
jgi:hypothetical protein